MKTNLGPITTEQRKPSEEYAKKRMVAEEEMVMGVEETAPADMSQPPLDWENTRSDAGGNMVFATCRTRWA